MKKKKVTIADTDYSLEEFGRVISSKRKMLNWTQTKLAEEAFKAEHEYDPEADFNQAAEKVKLGRIERGLIYPSQIYAEALFHVLDIDPKAKEASVLPEYRIEQIVNELERIVKSVQPNAAEAILSIAQMIEAGKFNNV